MVKEKFSKKLRSGKTKLTPQEKKDNMSHIGKRNQQWKEAKMQEAMDLWAQNDSLPPEEVVHEGHCKESWYWENYSD